MAAKPRLELGRMEGEPPGFADYEQSTAKKLSKLEKSLAEMDHALLGEALLDLIESVFSKASSKEGRPSCPLSPMLRNHLK